MTSHVISLLFLAQFLLLLSSISSAQVPTSDNGESVGGGENKNKTRIYLSVITKSSGTGNMDFSPAELSEALHMTKFIVARLWPPSWSNAVDYISDSTFQCVFRLCTSHKLRIIQAHDDADNAGEKAYIRSECGEKALDSLVALQQAVDRTFEKLPESAHAILEEFATAFKKLERRMVDENPRHRVENAEERQLLSSFVRAQKTLGMDDRRKIGQLFPAIADALADSRLDHLRDLLASVISGDSSDEPELVKLTEQVFAGPMSVIKRAIKQYGATVEKQQVKKDSSNTSPPQPPEPIIPPLPLPLEHSRRTIFKLMLKYEQATDSEAKKMTN